MTNAWPSVSDVTAAIATDSEETPTATDVEATAEAEKQEEATSPEAAAPSPTETTAPEGPSDIIARLIAEKGIDAFLDALPEDAVDRAGQKGNKNWHRRINERDNQIRVLRQEIAASAAATQQAVENKLDELITSGMSDEDKKAHAEKRELERHRANERARQQAPVDPLEDPATQRMIALGWDVVQEAGLPADPNDPKVRKVWEAGWNEPDPRAGIAKMRAAAQAYKPKPAPDTETVTKLATEMAEKIVQQRLKKELLSTDNGRAGGSSSQSLELGVGTRKAVEELFRKAL